MSFKDDYPEFADIDDLIRRARAERSLAVARIVSNAISACAGWFKHAAGSLTGAAAEADRRAIDADPFLKRSAPPY